MNDTRVWIIGEMINKGENRVRGQGSFPKKNITTPAFRSFSMQVNHYNSPTYRQGKS